MMTTTTWILFLAILGTVAGLEVGPVHLVKKKSHITYALGPSADNSRLICPYELSEGERLQNIFWVLWDGEEQAGTYEWTPTLEPVAGGLLEGVVNISRDDGDLELTELRYDLGGFYSCAITLTDYQVKEADKWEALIIDITSASSYTAGIVNQTTCTYYESLRWYTVYPPPTVRSGMYSDQLDSFYDEVTPQQWIKAIYPNKSIAYSYSDRAFKIDANTPDDARLRSTLGVTKTDGTYIPFTELITESIICELVGNTSLQEVTYFPWDEICWTTKGCPLPRLQEHQVLKYSGGYKNCRDQLVSNSLNNPVKAEVRCEKGYHAEGAVIFVKMVCNETFTWITDDGEEPRPEYLQCVIDKTDPGGGGFAGNVESSVVLVMGTFFLLSLLHQ